VTRFTVEHTCGHAAVHDIVGGNGRRRAWIATKRAGLPCQDCSLSAWKADVDSTNAYYAELAAEQGLPEIAGTDRQVPWAVGLRGELLDQVAENLPLLSKLCSEHQRPFYAGAAGVIRELAAQHTDSRWWIENRTRLPSALAEAHRKGLKLCGEAGVTARQLLLFLETVR
jgi:hypothetical protein